MRFCPFCAQENGDDSGECVHCGKRLPRARSAPPLPASKEKPIVAASLASLKPRPRPRPTAHPPAPPVESQQRGDPTAETPTRVDPPVLGMADPAPLPPPPAPSARTPTLQGVPSPIAPGQPSRTALGFNKTEMPPASSPPASNRRETKPLPVTAALAAVPVAKQFSGRDGAHVLTHRIESETDRHPLVIEDRSEPKVVTPSTSNALVTPAMPTLALPPMPARPRSASLVDAVRYLPPVARAMWSRKKAQDAIRAQLIDEQRILDGVLKDLGRAAREESLQLPALADEMDAVRQTEQRRARAESAIEQAEQDRDKERDHFIADDAARQVELERCETEVKAVEAELKQKGEARRLHKTEQRRLEEKISACEKRAERGAARAVKADASSPDKGGGPTVALNLRREAEDARTEAAALVPPRDAARVAAEALDVPIESLVRRAADGRATMRLKRKERLEAEAAHRRKLDELETAKHQAEAGRREADREITQRFVSVGTVLNLNRVDGARFVPIFARIDELKAGLNARETTILRLQTERRAYDRPAAQRGLIVVGVIAGVLVLLAILLIVFHAR